MSVKLGILIATRNRPNQIRQVLESIKLNTKLPYLVTIVSSGNPVFSLIAEFEKSLNVDYYHVEFKGQHLQKQFGIDKMKDNCDWILFLDDDVLLSNRCIENLIMGIDVSIDRCKNLIGIGLRTQSTSRSIPISPFYKILARIFLLDSKEPGKFLFSAHPVEYMTSTSAMETEWLTGISAWRSDIAKSYDYFIDYDGYSIFEDVYFSVKQRSRGTLLYLPNCETSFVVGEITNYDSANLLLLSSISRSLLSKSLRMRNLIFLNWSQLGRLMYFAKSQLSEQSGHRLSKSQVLRASWLSILYLNVAFVSRSTAKRLIKGLPRVFK